MTHATRRLLILLVMLFGATAAAWSADATQRLTVPITDPSRPLTLHASLFSSALTVEAHEGNQVLIEVVPEEDEEGRERAGGMRVIPNRSLGLTVEEQDNVVSISGDFTSRVNRIVVKVPRRTSVSGGTVNGGDIIVKGVEGEHELNNTNGSIAALDVSGSVVAQSTNGEIKVSFTKLEAGKSMSFVTFNGDVDVTFPENFKADLHISAGQGEIYTDFDFDLVPTDTQTKSEREGKKFRVQLEQDVRARINGGGPEVHFKTWNGTIYIRKRGR